VRWNPDTLSSQFATGVSEFQTVNLDNLRQEFGQHRYWLNNHFLNSVTGGAYQGRTRQFCVNFLFRATASFEAYHLARSLTLHHLRPKRFRRPTYYRALAAWELTILSFQCTYEVTSRLFGPQTDDDANKRLWRLANKVKHCGDDIENLKHGDPHLTPFWMTNEGLRGRETHCSWEEITDHVRSFARVADRMQNPRDGIQLINGEGER